MNKNISKKFKWNDKASKHNKCILVINEKTHNIYIRNAKQIKTEKGKKDRGRYRQGKQTEQQGQYDIYEESRVS